MIPALRISIGDITYQNVKIAMSEEVDQLGLIPVLGEHTVMFKHNNKWHACHNWELKLIHLSRNRCKVPGAIPYERLVISADKIYGPGMYVTNEVLREAGVRDLWLGIESQIAFHSIEGTFISTDYAITSIVFPISNPPIEGRAAPGIVRASTNGPNLRIRRGGTRPCRSS